MEAMDRDGEMHELHEREARHEALIARLRSEAGVREHDLADLRDRLPRFSRISGRGTSAIRPTPNHLDASEFRHPCSRCRLRGIG
jgi:hypothetical protein